MSDEDFEEKEQWVPDAAIQSMIMEKQIHTGETNSKTAQRLIDENSPVVAMSIIHLAIHSRSERTRLDAGRYVIDRVLGRVGEAKEEDEDTPATLFAKSVMQDIQEVVMRGVDT